jgi:hypothetical protein
MRRLKSPDNDVTLISHSDAQHLLQVLEVFCRLFGMEVNVGPGKTATVVSRHARTPLPRGLRLLYRGRESAVQPSYTSLEVVLHETKGLACAHVALAGSGSRAMHALLTKARWAGLTQFDIKCRAFDIMVESVLWYGWQVWGPQAVLHTAAV